MLLADVLYETPIVQVRPLEMLKAVHSKFQVL